MAKMLNKLTDRQVRTLAEGRHSDGGGLFLVVGKSTRRWIFIYRLKRPRGEGSAPLREMPIGRFGVEDDGFTSLAAARRKAADVRKKVADGLDPQETMPAPRAIPTFAAMADELIAAKEYRSDKSLSRIKHSLEHHARPLRALPVDKITEDDVRAVLEPIWKLTPIMAEKVRGYVWQVMENANDHYTGRNPATWQGRLEKRLPKCKRLKNGHRPALPYAEAPAFMAKLRDRPGVAARAFEVLILSAVRSAEVRLARWNEIDLDAAIWTIPEGRTKSERQHRVPLSGRTISILRDQARTEHGQDHLIFPSSKPGAPLSLMTFSKTLTLIGVPKTEAVPHGFRSSFRDWAEDIGGYSFELGEQAISHVVGDGTVRAYRRSDALEKRREMMEAWARYLGTVPD